MQYELKKMHHEHREHHHHNNNNKCTSQPNLNGNSGRKLISSTIKNTHTHIGASLLDFTLPPVSQNQCKIINAKVH